MNDVGKLLSVITLLLVLCCGASDATEVHWVPAHHLAPDGGLKSPAAGDLDGDSDYDISVYLSHFQYWNIGTPAVPTWKLDTSWFDGIPSCADPSGTYGDVDQDGDLDLVIGAYDERLRFCWNIGTPQEPAWQYDPSVFDTIWILPGGADPHFADLDADGDLDLTVTTAFCYVKLIENIGTSTEPVWAEAGYVDGITLDSGGSPATAFGDIDRDGDLDAIGVTSLSAPQCWENVGSPQSYEFVENPSMLIGVEQPTIGGFGLELFDIDADGDLDLLIAPWGCGGHLFLNEGYVPVESRSWTTIKAMFR